MIQRCYVTVQGGARNDMTGSSVERMDDCICTSVLLVVGVRLRIRLKRPKKKAQTFFTDADSKKIGARTSITCRDTYNPNTMWEDIKIEDTLLIIEQIR